MDKYQLTPSYRNRFALPLGFFSGLVLAFFFYVLVLKVRPEFPRFSTNKTPYAVLQSATIIDYILLIAIWSIAAIAAGYITYRMAKVLKTLQGAVIASLIILLEVMNILAMEMVWVITVIITLNVMRYWINARDKRMRLEAINEQLEKDVQERTAEITMQKEIVERQKEDILDSIKYAKRLQDAILPPLSAIKKHLPESFVLYKPKDIVAGDFYWLGTASLNPSEEGTMGLKGIPPSGGGGATLFIAACDCTGHGVPGAMVSVVCSNALNRAVKEFNLTEPGKILDKTRELVLETFEKSEGDVKDGMDISLCSLTPLTPGEGHGVRLQWAGAYNSLWYMQNGVLKEISGDKQPIGKHDNPKPFTTHTITISPYRGDKGGPAAALYLFTDGYPDQFGGPKGKKYKYKQLQQLIADNAHLPMARQKEVLEKSFEQWKGNMEQTDDVCVIGIKL